MTGSSFALGINIMTIEQIFRRFRMLMRPRGWAPIVPPNLLVQMSGERTFLCDVTWKMAGQCLASSLIRAKGVYTEICEMSEAGAVTPSLRICDSGNIIGKFENSSQEGCTTRFMTRLFITRRIMNKHAMSSKQNVKHGRATWDPAFGVPLKAACAAAQTLHYFFAFAFAFDLASAFPFGLASGLFSTDVSGSEVAPADFGR